MPEDSQSPNEERIRKITHLYYSRPEIQKIIYEFSKNREISPRYFEGFGKRPDTFEYPGDVFELVKRRATSFHCSEELWEDALKIETGMSEKQLNEIRVGWDLLIDIDCKWFDYSKLAARAIISTLKNYGIKNIGLKFSGSKGFHIIVPWKSFPKELAGENTKNLFPELPRKIISFLRFKSEEEMKKILPEDFYKQFKNANIKKGIKCNNCKSVAENYLLINYYCPKCKRQELKKLPFDSKDSKKVYKCPECRTEFEIKDSKETFFCSSCNISSDKNYENFSRDIQVDLYDLMGLDLILVSPRHLFRMPYSLHEKTSLSSVVINEKDLENFEMKQADPMKLTDEKLIPFIPESNENEAEEFVREALDWVKDNQIKMGISEEKIYGKYAEFKAIELKNLTEDQFPPSIRKILEGVSDGRKRALFVLINFFRSVGIEKEELEKKIFEWNKKNELPLKEGYITSQLSWAYRKKPILPPNFSTDYYKGIGINPEIEEMRFKNPVSYTISKNLNSSGKSKRKQKKSPTKN
jgi:DNA primase catalytic subunit